MISYDGFEKWSNIGTNDAAMAKRGIAFGKACLLDDSTIKGERVGHGNLFKAMEMEAKMDELKKVRSEFVQGQKNFTMGNQKGLNFTELKEAANKMNCVPWSDSPVKDVVEKCPLMVAYCQKQA